MTLLQIVSAILFFYVFGLAAVLMTWYIVRTAIQLLQQINREQQNKTRKHPPSIEEEPIKLHISEGLIEVNRLPDEKTEQ